MKIGSEKAFFMNKHAHLLMVILLICLSSPYINEIHPKIPVITPVFILAVFFILRTLGVGKKLLWIVAGLGVLVFSLLTLLNFSLGASYTIPLSIALCSLYCVLLLLCIFFMSSKLFSSSTVTIDTIAGGINVYFLLGFVWAFVYYIIYCVDSGAFHFSSTPCMTYFFIFSVSTLTTIGFGDMYPVNHWAMVLACLEGMTGQLYLAIFIARLVSMYAQVKQEKS
ncbi:MAG: ion channel [Candidatus Omnitrophota bacterium]